MNTPITKDINRMARLLAVGYAHKKQPMSLAFVNGMVMAIDKIGKPDPFLASFAYKHKNDGSCYEEELEGYEFATSITNIVTI